MVVRHRVIGWADPLPLRRIHDTDLWYVTTELPAGSRVEYQFELVRGKHREQYVNDPLNPRLAHGAIRLQLCALGHGVPGAGLVPDPEARPGDVVEQVLTSKALRREVHFRVYLPARFRTVVRDPLMIVHDGADYLHYTAPGPFSTT